MSDPIQIIARLESPQIISKVNQLHITAKLNNGGADGQTVSVNGVEHIDGNITIDATKIKMSADSGSFSIADTIVSLVNNSSYIYDQITAKSEWIVDHTLNKYPSVNVVDSAGELVSGDIQYISSSRIVLTFSSEFSGKAYLN